MKLVRSICFIAAILGCVALPNGVRAADEANAAARQTLERIQALRKERPGDGLLVFFEATVRIGLQEREAAFSLLRSLTGRKLGLIPVRDSGFDAIWDDPTFQEIRKQLADEEPKTPAAPVAFRLKDAKLIPEGIAYDPTATRFFIGSIAQRKIVVTDGKGEVRDFSKPSDDLDCVLGLTVDAKAGELYAVSSNGFLDAAKRARRNFVARYSLTKNALIEKFSAPDAMQLNDLALAPNGTIYATDSMGGTLFRKSPTEKNLKPLGAVGGLRGANGIAVARSGKLYVAISTGIARIDTATGEAKRLGQPDDVVTGGCDGLYADGDALIGIQNVTNPGRVVRISLADDGERISGLTVLQSHDHPEFDEPTTGALANGALHVIANSYVGHFQPDGTIKEPATLKPTGIVAVPEK